MPGHGRIIGGLQHWVIDNCMPRVAPNGILYATRLATVITSTVGLTYIIMLKGLNR